MLAPTFANALAEKIEHAPQGDKLFAIPWQALELNREEECFYLNVEKEKLESAPGFDKDDWPDMANERWHTSVYDYYEVLPYWSQNLITP